MQTMKFVFVFLFFITVLPAHSRTKKAVFSNEKSICERNSFIEEVSCNSYESFLFVKEKLRNFGNFISKNSNQVLRKIIIPSNLNGVRNIFSRVIHPTNVAPVINGNLRSIKTGSGIFPIVALDLPLGFSDSDGTIAKVTWDFGDGTEVEFLPSEFGTTAPIHHVYLNTGHYTVTVTVEDDDGAMTSVSDYVETPLNIEPSFNITAVNNSANNFTFTINPEDQDGSLFFYETTACSSSFDNYIFSCNFGAPGTYNVTSKIRDSKNVQVEGTTTLTVNGTALSATPVPIARASTYFGEAPLTVDFDATKSFDINGSIVSYSWNFGDLARPKNTSTSAKTSHTFVKPGQYKVQLTVKDNSNVQKTLDVNIYVASSDPQTPAIIANYTAAKSINLNNGRSAFTVPAHPSMYFWNFGNSVTGTGMDKQYTYAATGTYTVALKIVDLLGETHTVTKAITIGNTNDSPVAVLEKEMDKPYIGESTAFTAENSTDPVGSLALTYRWVFDDGEVVTDESLSKTFYEKGLMNAELWVTNTRGLSTKASSLLQVMNTSSKLEARIAWSPKASYAPATIELDGSPTISDAPITYQEWSIGGVSISNDESTEVPVTIAATYPFVYYVENANGDVSVASGSTKILGSGTIPGGNAAPVAVISQEVDEDNERLFDTSCEESTDSNDYVAYCSWKINGVAAGDGSYFEFEFPENIVYTLELTVSDSWGAKSTIYRTIDFSEAVGNLITFDHAPILPVLGSPTRFGAERTRILGKDIKSFSWTFGDSTSGTGRVVDHTYATAGSKTVQLSVVDSDNTTHTFSKVITVASSASFDFTISYQDSAGTGTLEDEDTFLTISAPEKILFSTTANNSSIYPIAYSIWTFSDGTKAFGQNIEHTFTKPGAYEVEVVSVDTDENEITKTFTVNVESVQGCYNQNGDNTCFYDFFATNQNTTIGESWVVAHALGTNFSTDLETYPDQWATLYTKDGAGKSFDISSAVVPYTNKLIINKNKLPANIDLSQPHEVRFVATSSADSVITGSWAQHAVANSKLTVNLDDTGRIVRLFNPSIQYHNEEYLDSTDEITFSNLPAGKYVVIIESEGESKVAHIDVNGTTEVREDSLSYSFVNTPKKLNKLNAKQELSTQSLCGENSPFPPARSYELGTDETNLISFSSSNPTAATKYKSLAGLVKNSVRLSCNLKHPGLLYGQNKWKYKNGQYRCWNNPNPHQYWEDYLKTLSSLNYPITIKYELFDEWTDSKTAGHLITSAQGLMLDNGWNLEDLTSKVGLPLGDTQNWGQKFELNIPIPPQFVRPNIRFELYSHHDSNPESQYAVDCAVISHDLDPKLLSIGPTQTEPDYNSKEDNGRKSLSPKFGLFPIQYDDHSTSPESEEDEIATVAYKATIGYYGRSDVEWQGIEIKFIYGDQNYSKFYAFNNTEVIDTVAQTFMDMVVINTADLEDKFSWVKGISDVQLEMTPVGKVTTNYDFEGAPKTMSFKAMFDLQTEHDESNNICANGFYGDELSTFVTAEYLNVLSAAGLYGNTRCGNASLPFGGHYYIDSTWNVSGKKFGTSTNLRSFNDETSQDDYESSTDPDSKLGDISEYMDFSDNITTISEIATETSGGNPTDKKKVFDYCKPSSGEPLYPCSSGTLFANISKEQIYGVCLLYTTTTTTPPGCPTVDIEKLHRFATWLDNNRSAFKSLSRIFDHSVKANSGWYSPVDSSEWQKSALLFGMWPDGMPIYKTDSSEVKFLPITMDGILTAFEFGANTYGEYELSTGWN